MWLKQMAGIDSDSRIVIAEGMVREFTNSMPGADTIPRLKKGRATLGSGMGLGSPILTECSRMLSGTFLQ